MVTGPTAVHDALAFTTAAVEGEVETALAVARDAVRRTAPASSTRS